MKIRRLLSRLYRDPEPGVDGTGDAPIVDTTPAPEADAAAPAPVDAPAPDAPDAPDGDAAAAPAPAVDPNAPKSLLEAISASVDGKKAEPVVDPKAPAVDAKKPAEPDPAAKPKPEDLTAMPEGLAPKAQERFRALVNVNKEISQEVEGLRAQTEYIGTTFKEHGVTREQFEIATNLIGAMNRGDWPTVIKGMQEEMRRVALVSGRPIDGIDMFSDMPDLKEKVENLQLSPEDAAELARGRTHQQIAQQRVRQAQQQQREQEQNQQQTQQFERARQQGVLAVDQLCAELKSKDLDFGRIEAALMPRVAELFQDVHPSKWAATLQRQYDLLKSMGAPARGNSAGTLRASGANNPVAKPADMFQAMFGEARP